MNSGWRFGRAVTAMCPAFTVCNFLRAAVFAGVLLLAGSPARAELFLVTVPCVSLLTTPDGTLAEGVVEGNTVAAIDDVAAGWVRVRLDGGQSGWLPLSSGRRIGPAPVARPQAAPARTEVTPAVIAPEKPEAVVAALPVPAVASHAAAGETKPVPRIVAETAPVSRGHVARVVMDTLTRELSLLDPRQGASSTPAVSRPLQPAREVLYYIRTDATVRTSENEITLPVGATLMLTPGDTRTRRAVAHGDVHIWWRALGEACQELRLGTAWLPPVPGCYAMLITGEKLRASVVRIDVVAGDGAAVCLSPASSGLETAPAVPVTGWQPAVARAPVISVVVPSSPATPVPAGRANTGGWAEGFDGSAVYRGLRFAPGMPLAPLVAAWGRPDEHYEKNGNRYYRFGPVTLMVELTDPERVSGVIFGAGWSVLGVQPGMMLAEVTARWGAPALPPLQVAVGIWRCGYLGDDFVLGCSLAGPDGPVTDISVTPRQSPTR